MRAWMLLNATHGIKTSFSCGMSVSANRTEGFIAKEETRVKKILKGKVNKEKKEELEERVNILKSFSSAKAEVKDEL